MVFVVGRSYHVVKVEHMITVQQRPSICLSNLILSCFLIQNLCLKNTFLPQSQ